MRTFSSLIKHVRTENEPFPTQSSLQVVRIPDHMEDLINQSALIDKHNNVVTYSVTSHVNYTSTVIFDMRHVRLFSFCTD